MHKRGRRPVRQPVNAPRHQRLAGARRAAQQHGAAGFGSRRGQRLDPLGRDGDAQQVRHLLGGAGAQQHRQPRQKRPHVERLGDVIRRPRLQQPHRLINPALSGDEQERRRGHAAAQGGEHLFAGAIRQADVADHRIYRRAGGAQRPDGPLRQLQPDHLGPFQRQALRDGPAHDLVILDKRDATAFQHGAAPAGRCTVTTVIPPCR